MPDSAASLPQSEQFAPRAEPDHAQPAAAGPSTTSTPSAPVLAVLDSNVWIDILVFDDPHTRPIRAALEAGTLCAPIDARCLAELTRVLDYPQFVERAVDKTAALATVARLTQMIEPPAPNAANPANTPNATDTPGTPGATGNAPQERPLPKCKDRDDQKFLELAHRSGAAWLVSKDRAVLKLAKRVARDFCFQIAQPAPFVAQCGIAVTPETASSQPASREPTLAAPTQTPAEQTPA